MKKSYFKLKLICYVMLIIGGVMLGFNNPDMAKTFAGIVLTIIGMTMLFTNVETALDDAYAKGRAHGLLENSNHFKNKNEN